MRGFSLFSNTPRSYLPSDSSYDSIRFYRVLHRGVFRYNFFLSIQLTMSSYLHEFDKFICPIRIFSEYGTIVARDIDRTISLVFSGERVIMKLWIELISSKNIYLFNNFTLYNNREFSKHLLVRFFIDYFHCHDCIICINSSPENGPCVVFSGSSIRSRNDCFRGVISKEVKFTDLPYFFTNVSGTFSSITVAIFF
jgi:hypothetical protein